jgi:hypothetical protein
MLQAISVETKKIPGAVGTTVIGILIEFLLAFSANPKTGKTSAVKEQLSPEIGLGANM